MATQFPGGQSVNNQFYNPYQGYQSGYHGWAPQYGYYGYIPYPPPQAPGPGIAEPVQGTTSGQYNPLQPNALPGAQPTAPVTPTVPQAEGIFAPHVQAAQLDTHYKIPVKLTPYTGEKDPEDHMRSFQIAMQISNMGDPQRCKLFPATLEGPALDWFSRLPYGSIHCFRDLEKLFMKRFASSKVYKQPQAVLADVHQSKGETLRDYLARFNKTCLGIKDIDERVAVHAFLAGIRPGFAQKELAYRNPSSLGDLLTQVEEFITKEDLDRTQRNRFARMDPTSLKQ